MRIFGTLTLFLLAGLSSSAILDSKESKTKTDWDDEDSMILPSTTSRASPSVDAISPEKKVVDNRIEETQPKFISLIPSESQVPSKYEYTSSGSQSESESNEHEELESSSAVPPSSEYPSNSDESTEDQRKDLPKTHLMQLGKIPLKLQVMPLLSPEHDQLLGRKNEKPIELTDEAVTETESEKEEKASNDEQNQHPSGEEVSDDVVRIRNEENIPQEPLTYLTPPKLEENDYWKQYPVPDESRDNLMIGNLASTPFYTHEEESQTTPTTSINPILLRLNDFLQKAKRHSLEEKAMQDQNDNVNAGENFEEATTQEDALSDVTPDSLSHTTETIENSGEQVTPDLMTNVHHHPSMVNIPRPGVPEIVDYQPESQPLPYRESLYTPSLNRIISGYYNLINNQRAAVDPYPYSYSGVSNVMSSTVNPSRGSIYIPNDSYWPRKYFYDTSLNDNYITPPLGRYNEYLRPQRSNIFLPSSNLLNGINEERPFIPSTPDSDASYYGSFIPRRYGADLDRSYYNYPSSYVLNQRPLIPYRPRPNYYSSPLVNDLMYAPSYSYQQYKTISPSTQNLISSEPLYI